MKTSLKFLTAVFVFITLNGYAGICLFQQLKESREYRKPVSVEVLRARVPKLAARMDADRDGEDEVIFAHPGTPPNIQYIGVFRPIARDYLQEYYGDTQAPLNYIFFDCYFNPRLNTYVFKFLDARPNGLFAQEIDNRGKRLQRELEFEKMEQPFSEGGNWAREPALVDLDADGTNELVIILKSDYSKDPRGAACFDPVSGKKNWEYYAGAKIENAAFFDLDQNGKKEIILTSFAANEGVEINGTSDAFSYVIVLDAGGKERWKQKIGAWPTFSHCFVSDLDRDGRFEIVAAAECDSARSTEQGKVFLFDAETGEQKRSFPTPVEIGISFSKPYVWKEGNAEPRIYTGDSGGNLRVLDKHLLPLEKIEMNGPAYVLNVSPPDEKWYYLYTRCQNRLRVFDWDLETEIFTMDFDFEG
ncbi:MAG: PQQ-like beta-propeller repeat protein, partial [bacterium]|nr:PQQ-like beta-propeller repeat protein [bacterium]